MGWLLLNLPFMIFATALILGILGVGMYLEYRKQDAVDASKAAHPASGAKVAAKDPEKVA